MTFTEAQMKALEAKLNGKHVRTRIEGGRELSYIEGWHVVAEANRVFGYDGWDRETVAAERVWQAVSGGTTRCSYVARVRVRVRAGDALVVREGNGAGHGSAGHAGEAHEQALKEAETDATKRALSTFGNVFGLALYDREQRGVRAAKHASKTSPTPARPHKGTLVLVLSETQLEVFERPEGFCSAFRQVLELIKSADALMAFWRANQEAVIALRQRFPQLKTDKGVHYAQILGELYTRRLQAFAEQAKGAAETTAEASASQPMNGAMVAPRRRDKGHLEHVASQPCLVCGRTPAHAHHLRFTQPRAMGKKVSDEYTVPLCALHHRELHDAGDEEAWWQRKKINPVPVAEELWQASRGKNEMTSQQKQSVGAERAQNRR